MTSYRRLAVPFVAAAVVLLSTVAPGAFGAQAAKTGPTGPSGTTGSTGVTGLVATVSACHIDPLQGNRYAIFQSQMTAVAGTRTMTVSFVLQVQHTRKGAFATVAVPGFGSWVHSQPGVGIFTYSHEVTSLPAPAAFRVLIRARWLDRHHRVIRHEDIDSTACVQPLLQPNLAIGQPLSRHAGSSAGTAVYGVVVRNDGTAAANNFAVGLTVNGVAQPSVTIPSLAADSTQIVEFTTPRCTAGTSIVATADAAGALTEPANPSRSRTFACGH
jgi:hypothetical protein